MSAAERAPLGGRRVLIVDDEPATLDVLCASLEADGCTVLVATTGAAAVRAARRSRPDLVVLDIGLPGMDGYRTCERLHEHPATAATPVVFLSASEAPDAEARVRAAGGADFIRKRLSWETVLARIRNHLLAGRVGETDETNIEEAQ